MKCISIKNILGIVLKYFKALVTHDRKTLNELKNNFEYSTGKIVLKSVPQNYVLGITNVCNLKCPLCITGLRLQRKQLGYMTYELFVRIIDKIKDNAKLIQLYNWGESLLHKDFIRILEYCNRYDLNTEVSSNLSLSDVDDKIEAMVKHRLKRLIVSFDGVTQKDYERYRVNGEFNLVLKNIEKIKTYKTKYQSKFPIIILQFLRNKYADGQLQILRDNYRKWGADEYLICDMTTIFKDRDIDGAREWFDDDEIARRKFLDIDTAMHGKRCYFLYTTMVIDHDGTIAPCCFTTDPNDDFTSWDDGKTIREMYNSEKFIKVRQMFNENKPVLGLACSNCSAFITYCGLAKK